MNQERTGADARRVLVEGGGGAGRPGWAEALLEAEEPALARIAGRRPVAEVLGALAAMVEGLLPGCGGSIMLADPAGRELGWAVTTATAAAVRDAIGPVPIAADAGGRGGCGAAASRNEPVVCPDIAVDPLWAAARGPALAAGFRASWSVPIRDPDGRVLGTVGVLVPVTGPPGARELRTLARAAQLAGIAVLRDRAEAALRSQDERFRRLADALPQIVWNTGTDGRVEYFNRRWYDYTGLTIEESLADDGWSRAVHPDDLPRLYEQGRLSVDSDHAFEAEYRLRDRHGTYRWHLGRALPVRDGDGRVARRFGTATDIDDRRRTEQDARFLAEASASLAALADQDSALRKVARLAVPHFADWCAVDLLEPDGSLRRVEVAHVDPGRVAFAHEYHRRYPPDRDAPSGLYHVVRTGTSERLAELTDAMIDAGVHDEEHRRAIYELSLRSYMIVPLRGRDATLGAMTFASSRGGRSYTEADLRLAEDLAHRAAIALDNARLYDALREADRRKDEFLAVLAHELRNPMAPLRNAAHLIARGDATEDDARAGAAMIERQVSHLARLVDDLLDVSRINRGKIELRPEPVEVAPLLARAVESVRPALVARRHELAVSWPDRPLFVRADPTRLEQVVWNLLSNAIKYTQPGGHIALSAAAEDDGAAVAIRVRDDGLGIDPAVMPRIFELFVQDERKLDQAQGGLGVGLCLVRSLVELHGGTVSAASAGAGLGSEFVVRLPALAAAEAPASPRPSAANAPGRRRRVLVVDDNADAAESLARVLDRRFGQEVAVAHDGPSALDAAAEFRPELVLLDLGMPGMTGHEVARQLRARPETADALLVALTGWGQEADRRRSAAAGFDHHLVKPIELDALLALLAD